MPSTQEAMSAASEGEKLSQVVLGSLEDDANAGQLARRAYRSRAQFFRVFGALRGDARGHAAAAAARASRPRRFPSRACSHT
jgi:hypothetical protein